MLSFSVALAEELEGSGITVTALCPGATKTQFHRRAQMEAIPLLRRGVLDAASVAETGYKALMRGRRVVVPGAVNQAQLLLARLAPSRWVVRMAKGMLQTGD